MSSAVELLNQFKRIIHRKGNTVLYIHLKDKTLASGHVDDQGSLKHLRTVFISTEDTVGRIPFLALQADGDELERIRLTFDNIPFSKTARVQNWRGETALFIIEHLT